jgi:hypothetical protein
MSHETAARQQLMENHLVACIQEYLQLNLTKNSVFLAERLVAQFPNENNLHLLATCYHRSGQTFRAYHLLRGSLVSCLTTLWRHPQHEEHIFFLCITIMNVVAYCYRFDR